MRAARGARSRSSCFEGQLTVTSATQCHHGDAVQRERSDRCRRIQPLRSPSCARAVDSGSDRPPGSGRPRTGNRLPGLGRGLHGNRRCAQLAARPGRGRDSSLALSGSRGRDGRRAPPLPWDDVQERPGRPAVRRGQGGRHRSGPADRSRALCALPRARSLHRSVGWAVRNR